ncbi:WD repeat protein [Cladophialophora carrionii]|uniref:WD repeat protein n=1 Tax=Cladophialophora carrionii TaxID=86049 RepID=A0A1C1C7C1_9EURO|nr:WD repeat protein [Cladophialophora carrionii]
MAKKKRQRISYVLPLAASPGGHRLGVNGLAFDEDRDILYTGGRDGVVCAWNLDLEAQRSQQDAGTKDKKGTVSFRKQVQAHTHWVNDIVLVKNNLGLVSASSDVTVKLWRPHGHETTQAYTIGSHSDYIKCLATPDRTANWVVSGGLDHKICLWDLNGAGKNLEIDVGKIQDVVKGSVYALRARGSLLASGGPESVVRLWDVKSGKSITKLVGHTDNVRDILISDDGDTLLTASSDQTIKVWSIAAGRCVHTLTMHNDSVWCMYSDDPNLAVFYSGDKSGLVAKTDTRRAMEIDDGVSVAICQEHDGIARVLPVGDFVWTATSSSSVNRWLDVDTELDVETPPSSPREERAASPEARKNLSPEDARTESPTSTKEGMTNGTTNGEVDHNKKIPHTAILRVSNTALLPGRKNLGRLPNASATNLRKASEVMIADDLSLVVPVRGQPAETIEGQNGLIKHVMLNDRKRILTLDTAGEVVLWDLLRCTPIKSFGRRHLDEVVPEVNTTESVANWCGVDTKTGKITVMLEENYCFDAEVYADEVDLPDNVHFREDQRINLGKWVLRNLFSKLIDEEIARDEEHRRTLQSKITPPPSTGLIRPGAPTSIAMPESVGTTPMVSPGTAATPRANGLGRIPPTPGLAIGAATPGFAPLSTTLSTTAEEDGAATPNGPALTPRTSTPKVHTPRVQQTPSATESQGVDYFSSSTTTAIDQSEASSDSDKVPKTPGIGAENNTGTVSTPTSPTEEKKKGLFGKKFGMGMSLGKKMTTRTSAEVKAPVASAEEKLSDTASMRSSDKETEKVHNIEDNFFGVVQKIRLEYDEHIEHRPDQPLPPGITPSPSSETPVLAPPPHTTIIIQEDNPESGGLADQYRGEISELGNPSEVDTLEKIAPMWLGDLLLRNQIPYKDTVKVSFVLHPYDNLLPAIASPDGNARLNANRMLRAKKIMAYVAERIEAPAHAPIAPPPDTAQSSATHTDSEPPPPAQQASEAGPTEIPAPDSEQENAEEQLKPEEYLELYCQGQRVDPNTTLATLRVHVWRIGGDVVLYYKSNGRKELRLPHPAQVPTREESEETTGVVR